MMNKKHMTTLRRPSRQSGNIFFMLFASIALIGAMTVGAGNVVKGIVTSMSEVTRKTVAEEKMQGAARISVMNATSTQANSGDCDGDGMVEPLPYRDAGTATHPIGGGYVPQNIGATTKDPWGTEYGYCAWDTGATTVSDNNATCGGTTAKRLEAADNSTKTVVAVISAGKDRKFSTTCNPTALVPQDCTGLGTARFNDPVSGHCYWQVNSNVTQPVAQAACTASGGYLFVPSSSAEDVMVRGSLTVAASTWIGLDDSATEGEWFYSYGDVAGTKFWTGGLGGSAYNGQFANWLAGQPNNAGGVEDCAIFGNSGNPQWIDKDCTGSTAFYICEKGAALSSPVTKATGSDDIVMEYTYDDANGMSGDDLWKVKDTEPGTAKIDKNLDVTGGADLSGPLNLMKSGLILPDDGATGACDATTDQQLRINFSNNPAVLEICDFAGGNGWTAVSMGGGGSPTVKFLKVGTGTWTVPGDVSTVDVEIIGAGGKGFAANGGRKPGGGGGAYVKKTVTVTPGGSESYSVAAGGSGANTWFSSGATVMAKAGANATSTAGGAGGAAASSIGDTKYSGGAGGVGTSTLGGAGGGGAAGPNGNGALGGDAVLGHPGGGGGGANGGSAGADSTCSTCAGANGGNNRFGTGGGAGALSANAGNGVNGGGGGGVYPATFTPGDGGMETIWTETGTGATAGPTGGGGGGTNNLGTKGGDGTPYGGGSGGSRLSGDEGTPGDGLIVLTYQTAEVEDTSGPPTNGLVGYWKLDETSGSAIADDSGNSNNGTWTDNTNNIITTESTTRSGNSSLDFSQSDHSVISVPPSASLNNLPTMSVCAWIKPGTLTDDFPMPVGKFTLGDTGWGIYIDHLYGGYVSFINGKYGYKEMTYVLNTGTWYHVCATWDGTDGSAGNKIYVNGTELTSVMYTGDNGSGTANDSAVPLKMGWNSVATNAYNGGIDEVLVYNRVLSATEISDIYNGSGATAALTVEQFLTHPEVNQCTSAGSGPFKSVGSGPDSSNTYRGLMRKNNMLFSAGNTSGFSAIQMNGDGTMTRITTASSGGGNSATDMYTDGTYYYVANSAHNLVAFTYNGSAFTQVGTINTPGASKSVTGYANYIFVADGTNGVVAYTFDGTTFTSVATFATTNAQHVWTDGQYIYVSDLGGGVRILTFDGSAFKQIDNFTAAGNVTYTVGDGSYLYVNATTYLEVYAFDGTSASKVGTLWNDGYTLKGLFTDGANVYSGWTNKMLYALRFDGKNFRVLASVPTADTVENIRSDGSYLYASSTSNNIQVFSGFSCYTSNNVPPATAAIAVNQYAGKISAGSSGGCGIKPDGVAWCWGGGADGQIGNGTTTATNVAPVRVRSQDAFVYVTMGARISCGIKSDGSGYCWGDDANGQQGNGGAAADQTIPGPVSGNLKWRKILGGDDVMCGITQNGDAYCWGRNNNGQTGTGSAGGTKTVPTIVTGSRKWVDISVGSGHACGIDNMGQAWCWGSNSNGQLGAGEYGRGVVSVSNPALVRDVGPWVKISAGYQTTCGLKLDGTAWCWGNNNHGKLGIGASDGTYDAFEPVQVGDVGPWAEIDISHQYDLHTVCGIKMDGSAWCWGSDTNAVLGNGGTLTSDQTLPSRVLDPGPWSTISVGAPVCGMHVDGSAWCWGSDTNGALGNGAAITGNADVPSRVENFPNIQPWTWNDANTSITGGYAGNNPANIGIGTGTIGYTAQGVQNSCTGLGTPAFTDAASGHCYYKVSAGATWANAQSACATNGAYLASINSQHEQMLMENWFGTATELWMGASDSLAEGVWIYTGGEKAGQQFWSGNYTGSAVGGNFTNWLPNDPTGGTSENCGVYSHLSSATGKWHDMPCSNSKPYICEKGISEYNGGLSFPQPSKVKLEQYNSGSELMLESSGTGTAAQVGWKAPTAANTRSMGIDPTSNSLEFSLNDASVAQWAFSLSPQVEITSAGYLGVGTSGTAYNKLDVNGGIRIGNDPDPCTAMRAGTLRYVGGGTPYEYCNGTVWTAF